MPEHFLQGSDRSVRHAHARSINIPLYRPITGWDFRKFMRRAGFAFFGIFNVSRLGSRYSIGQ